MVVASVGPTTSEMLREHDLPVDIEPEHPKMGPLIAAAAEKSADILEQKRGAGLRPAVVCFRLPSTKPPPGTTARS